MFNVKKCLIFNLLILVDFKLENLFTFKNSCILTLNFNLGHSQLDLNYERIQIKSIVLSNIACKKIKISGAIIKVLY